MIDALTHNTQVYLNGEFLPLSEAKVSVLDRGFIFGDGIYEVVPVYNRQPFRLEQHVARLMRSLAAIRLESGKSAQEWQDLMSDMAQRAPWDSSFIYLQITRGVAKRDHGFPNPAQTPTVFLMSSPLKRPTEEMREQGLSVLRMDDERWLHCDIKSISLLGNVLARQYAVDQGVNDVVMFRNGYLSESSSANVWIVTKGKLRAPIKNNLILEGIRYGFLEELCQKIGIEFKAGQIPEVDVEQADEILLTCATKEILPITIYNGKPVADGKPGPIYRKLRQAYDDVLNALLRA